MRKTYVPIDPKQCFLRIASGDCGIELADVYNQADPPFEELGAQDIVARLVNHEPDAVVVFR